MQLNVSGPQFANKPKNFMTWKPNARGVICGKIQNRSNCGKLMTPSSSKLIRGHQPSFNVTCAPSLKIKVYAGIGSNSPRDSKKCDNPKLLAISLFLSLWQLIKSLRLFFCSPCLESKTHVCWQRKRQKENITWSPWPRKSLRYPRVNFIKSCNFNGCKYSFSSRWQVLKRSKRY